MFVALHFLQISSLSALIEASCDHVSASAFSLLRYVVLVEMEKGNLASLILQWKREKYFSALLR